MGRRQFRQDLLATTENPPPHICNIETVDDGEISFNYTYSEFGHLQAASLQLLALNVDDYPEGNDYMIFSRDGNVAPSIAKAFEILSPIISNASLHIALTEISNGLHQAVTRGQAHNPIVLANSSEAGDDSFGELEDDDDDDNDNDDDGEGAEDWFNDDDDDDDAFGFNEPKKSRPITVGRSAGLKLAAEDRKKIKADLRETKEAGFKVGVLGDLNTSGIVVVSIRISKLGISEEVQKAWGLEPQQYFVLLIRCLNGYRGLEILREESSLSGSTEIRLGLCSSYKPNAKSAFESFNEITQQQEVESQLAHSVGPTDLRPLFIGRPLNELFRSRFTRIIKFREVFCLGWSAAEQLVHDTQGAIVDPENMNKYDLMIDNQDRALPDLVMADTFSTKKLKDCPLPLVAMQFALRHFVRCTEFCLVCHCSSGSTFEALKPYVCSNPLCLYQYMGLGFGPSIEWEILSQPYVVDLLVSFCYAQAQAGRLRDFPVGIDLRVPLLPQYLKQPYSTTSYRAYGSAASQPYQTSLQQGSPEVEKSFTVPYNHSAREILFPADQVAKGQALKKGDFIAIVDTATSTGIIFHRIDDVMLPSVKLGPPVIIMESNKDTFSHKLPSPPASRFSEADCYLFNHHFDELSDEYKSKSIMTLLDTIPPVKEMLQYLKTHSVGQDSSLRQWRERISPAALNVLRWIIASNRSCIMQVDNVIEKGALEDVPPFEDRVSGMDDYMQFRFAQGAPDKEQRFIDCVKKHAEGKQHQTIFAWHGSPLHNWHSIIREGLHFRDTAHGRAYGHGVYMSPMASTSTGYMGGYYGGNASLSSWQNSELKVTSAMSLNEVVNNTTAFVSSTPHYVVAETDWIQTRYLLVKTSASHSRSRSGTAMKTIPQDPYHTPKGISGGPVQIPVTAVSKSRRPVANAGRPESKKRKSLGSGRYDEPFDLIDDEDTESVATLNEDREYLLDDESHTGHTPIVLDSDIEMMLSDTDMDLGASPKKKLRQDESRPTWELVQGCMLDKSKTDFFPGRLDMSNVKILPPPEDASRSSSNALLKAFNALLKTQRTTLAHDLGWYINPEQVENMYQWIVELHSFDKDIPLAQDMKQAQVSSIVLEMRFTNSYPFAPPFVRVIKPRFLPFGQGGGGHVTEGGAICMELLTNNGWSAVSSVESVLLQIRLAMSEKERPGRLVGASRYGNSNQVYGVGEAIIAYERACRAHGWTVPAAFAELQRGEDRRY